MTLNEVREIVAKIHCEVGGTTWNIFVGHLGHGFYVQLRYLEPDVETGDSQDQHGRKWYISPYSVESEIVQTVLKAGLTSAEHMIREHFTYKGERVFSPHLDIHDLIELSKNKKRAVRTPAKVQTNESKI